MVTRCPLTWGLFLGSAALVIRHKRCQLLLAKKDDSTATTGSSLPLPLPASCEVVFVLGAPGTGKGTQCHLLTERLERKWTHLSAGDLLRAARDEGTSELAGLIRAKMREGAIVPSSITVRLLEEAMAEAYAKSDKNDSDSDFARFLIDGFPRSDENLSAWEERMGDRHTVRFVLNFECPEEILIGRLLERAKDSGRSDDAIGVIRKRFATHATSTVPILEHFREGGTTVHTIDSARSVEGVFASVAPLFG